MSQLTQALLATELRARMTSFSRDLSPEVRAPLDALLTRRGYLNASGALFRPLGHPVVLFGSWLSRGTPQTTEMDIAESSLFGYLHVRLQDDHLDDGDATAAEVMVVGDVLLARHTALLARHVNDDEFWMSFEGLWTDYATAMVREQKLDQSDAPRTADDFERLLGRSRPLAIPGLTMLALTGRWELAAAVRRLTNGIIRSGQLVTDLIDAPADLAAERFTWMVERFNGRDGPVALRREMVRQFDDVVAEAQASLDDAAEAADALQAPDATTWIETRRHAIEQLQRDFFTRIFSPSAG